MTSPHELEKQLRAQSRIKNKNRMRILRGFPLSHRRIIRKEIPIKHDGVYRITYIQGNRYHDHRRCVYITSEDLETPDDVCDWVIMMEADKQHPRTEYHVDRLIVSIELVVGVDIKDRFLRNIPNCLIYIEVEKRRK